MSVSGSPSYAPVGRRRAQLPMSIWLVAAADLGGALQVRGGSGTTVTVTLPPG